jgi:hypothetical protein
MPNTGEKNEVLSLAVYYIFMSSNDIIFSQKCRIKYDLQNYLKSACVL